jgi:hypothetical protein
VAPSPSATTLLPMSRFDQIIERLVEMSSLSRSVHECLQMGRFADRCFSLISPGFSTPVRSRAGPSEGFCRGHQEESRRNWRSRDDVGAPLINPSQTSANFICAQVLDVFGRNMWRDVLHERIPPKQRAASRLHELPGGSLPWCLTGHDPSLDGRRPRRLLSHPGRSAALLASSARRVHLLDAGRRTRNADDLSAPRRLSGTCEGPARDLRTRLRRLSWRGVRTSRADGDKRRSPEAGPAYRRL